MSLDLHIMLNMAVVQQKYTYLFNSKLKTFGLNNKPYDFLNVICFWEKVSQVEPMEIFRIDKAVVARRHARLGEKRLIYIVGVLDDKKS